MSAGMLALLLWLAARAGGRRIVGGQVASIAEFPFLTSLQRRYSGHCCVANVVTFRWLLTAAHCVTVPLGSRPRDYVVVAGVSNVTAAESKEGQRGYPDLFVVHPLVRHGGSYDYDLALIRLGSPLEEARDVRTVPLAWDTVPPQLLYSDNCTVAGWGDTEKVDIRRDEASYEPVWEPRPLRKVVLPLMKPAICSKLLRRVLRDNVHLCTYCSDKDACQGDSGAALICQGVQVAVVSWGKGCASDYPGVYARIDTQMAWLQQVISEEPSPLPCPALLAACLLLVALLTFP